MRDKITLIIACIYVLFSSYTFALDASFDLSVNPEANASAVVGTMELRWNTKYNSIFNFSFTPSTEISTVIPGFGTGIQSTEVNRFQCDILPLSFSLNTFFCDMGLSFGASYIGISEKVFALFNDTDGVLTETGTYVAYKNNRDATIWSPRVGVSFSNFNTGLIRISYTGYVSPLYFLSLQQEVSYDFLSYPSTNHISRWSSPYFDQRLDINIYNLRGVISHSYQRLDFQTMDWDSNGERLIGVDDVQSINNVQLGLELLMPIRAGTVRFKGGVYWQNNYTSSTYWNTVIHSDRFTFSFGIEG